MSVEVTWLTALWFLVFPAILVLCSLFYGSRKVTLLLYCCNFLATDPFVKSFVILVILVQLVFLVMERHLSRKQLEKTPSSRDSGH